jgi:N-acetylglucosamine malate deacetylase 1
MPKPPLRLLIIGAHPDDAEYHAGGTAALYRAAGHVVKMVSITNCNAGHHVIHGLEVAERRQAEAAAAGAVIGASYDVLDNYDGELLPTEPLAGDPPDPHLPARPGADPPCCAPMGRSVELP